MYDAAMKTKMMFVQDLTRQQLKEAVLRDLTWLFSTMEHRDQFQQDPAKFMPEYGGFCAYGLIENRAAAREVNALPIAMSDDCVLLRDVKKDEVISFDDVRMPAPRLVDRLWQEQLQRWPAAGARAAKAEPAIA